MQVLIGAGQYAVGALSALGRVGCVPALGECDLGGLAGVWEYIVDAQRPRRSDDPRRGTCLNCAEETTLSKDVKWHHEVTKGHSCAR
jgi:hypothetical protein